MSARNRELLALIPVALLVTAGFTSVLLVDNLDVGNVTLTYGGYFLAICVAIHILIRIRLPYADPYLFPLVALLAAVGLVVLYRIDESLALEQASLMVLGAIVFAATIVFVRDLGVLERYRYLIAIAGIVLLLLPRLPGIGAQVNGAYLGVDIGPIAFQPAELAKICIVIFLASYLREHREVMLVNSRKFLTFTWLPMKHLGPLLVVWGASMVMLVFIRDLGSSLMFFGAFLALLYVATNSATLVLQFFAMFAVGAYFFSKTVSHIQDRVDIWLDPFARNAPDGAGQITQSLFAQAEGGLFGEGLGQSLLTPPGPLRARLPRALPRVRQHPAGAAHRLHLRRDHVRARPLRRLWGRPHLRPDRGPRLQGRAHRPGRVLEASRHRPHRGARPPGLRDHRRRRSG